MGLADNVKLAFFDIDGTLVGKSGVLTQRTICAINCLRERGVAIALATGRPLFGTSEITRQLSINSFSLFSSGAHIANPFNSEVLFEAQISPNLVKKCIELARALGLYTELYSRDGYFTEIENSITKKHSEYLKTSPSIANFEEVLNKVAINKVVTISDSAALEEKQREFSLQITELLSLCSKGASHPELVFNNITSRAASRRGGFARILAKLGVSSDEVIAFGDAESDLDFITLAGIGVAMEDAPPSVKARAQIVAPSADCDGVGEVIERLLKCNHRGHSD